MQHRRTLVSLSLAALTAGTVLMLAGSAGADVTGPCTATMNGVDVNTIDTPGTALEVPYNGTVSVDVVSSGAITSHAAFAGRHAVRFAPTVLILGPRGEQLAAPLIGFGTADYYGYYLGERIDTGLSKVRR